MALRDSDDGAGLLIMPATCRSSSESESIAVDASGWGWSASHYSTEALHRTLHDHELVPDPNHIDVHIDSFAMGVGGYDSWTPNVEGEYLLRSGRTVHTKCLLIPLLDSDDPLSIYFSKICVRVR